MPCNLNYDKNFELDVSLKLKLQIRYNTIKIITAGKAFTLPCNSNYDKNFELDVSLN